MAEAVIRKENIPSYALTELAQAVAASVQNFFSDPEHRQAFEAWKKERDMKERTEHER